jgi:hypothetical protein
MRVPNFNTSFPPTSVQKRTKLEIELRSLNNRNRKVSPVTLKPLNFTKKQEK